MKCDCCGTKIFKKQDLKFVDGEYICPNCLIRYYRSCKICGRLYKYKDYLDVNCKSCEDAIYKNYINSYNTKPYPRFVNFNKDTRDNLRCRYYGLEMEFSNTSPLVLHDKIKDLYDKSLIYNKRDGSLNNGVEVVTSPLDKKSLIKLIKDMGDSGFKYVGENYSSNAGIHIHVNLMSIDVIDRYKLNILLNYSCGLYEKNILYYLSGRKDSATIDESEFCYCSIGERSILNYKKDIIARHSALNPNNKSTFEFRIFKSSNDVDTILSYIYIVDTMIDFCHNNGIKDISINNYILYLKKLNGNTIIDNKIKEFEKLNGEVLYYQNVFSDRIMLEQIKNIKWYEYYKLINYIGNKKTRKDIMCGIMRYKNDIKNGKISIKLSSSYKLCNKLSSKCMETLKCVITNKIMKEVNKCA